MPQYVRDCHFFLKFAVGFDHYLIASTPLEATDAKTLRKSYLKVHSSHGTTSPLDVVFGLYEAVRAVVYGVFCKTWWNV